MSSYEMLEWQTVLAAGISLIGAIIVAWISFYSAIKSAKNSSLAAIEVAKVTADANMKQALRIKAHDALVTAIKNLTHRHDICCGLLNLIVDDLSEDRVRLNIELFNSLSEKFSETVSLDLETLSVLPYVRGKLPRRNNCDSRDLDTLARFRVLCKRINSNILMRKSTALTLEEITELSAALNEVKGLYVQEKEFIGKTLDVLYSELNRIDEESVLSSQC